MSDPIQDIARQLGIQTFGDGLLAKIGQTIDLLRDAAQERDQLRAELAASDQALRESRANDLTTMATLADVRAELSALKAQQVGQEPFGYLADDGGAMTAFFRAEDKDQFDAFCAEAEPLNKVALYTAPQPAPAQDVAIPERKETGEWESARIADFNSGWNACLDEVVALLEKAAWMELDTTNRSISIQDEIRSALAAHDKQSGGEA